MTTTMKHRPRYQMVLQSFFFTVLLLLLSSDKTTATNQNDQGSPSTNGNTIVTLSHKHTSTSSTSSTTNEQQQLEQKHLNPEAQRLQNLADASTGTVTYGEKAPVTCNEIMAKAVVVASEEKEKAFLERDNALSEAVRATERANLLSEQIEIALEDAKNATIEYEAVKLMTDRLVEEVKKTSKETLGKKEEEHALVVQQMNDDMESMKQDYIHQIDNIKAKAHEDMEDLKVQTANQIEVTNNEANKRITEMEEKVQKQKEQSEKDIIQIKAETNEKIEIIKQEYQTKEEETKQLTSINIQNIQNQATEEINVMKQKVANITIEMDELKKSTQDEIDAIKLERDEEINRAYMKSQEHEHNTMERAYKIERDTEYQMEQLRKDVNREIKDTYKSAEKEYEKLRKEATAEIKKIVEDSNQRLDEKENEILALNDEALKEKNALQSIINSLNTKIEEMTESSSSLDSRLSSTNEELEYWKDVGMNPTYVNTTLIMHDTKTYLSRTASQLKQKTCESLKITTEKIYEFSKPHLEQMTVLLNEFYDEKLKETVDTVIHPFYQEHIVPVQEKTTNTYDTTIIPKVKQLNDRRKVMVDKTYAKTCDGYKTSAKTIREALEEQAVEAIPKFFYLYLKRVENNPSKYVMTHIKVLLAFIIFLLRATIISLVWYVVTLPFRIVWFFCPLRLVVGGGQKSKNSKKGMKRMKNGQKNGYSGVVKTKKENGSNGGK